MTVAGLMIGILVYVWPNLLSRYEPDHREAVWSGRIIYEIEGSYGVEPIDGRLPRDVLKERVSICQASV